MSSIVWNYFTLSQDNISADCKICLLKIMCKNKCTSGLIRHLRSKHGDKIDFDGEAKRSRPTERNNESTLVIENNENGVAEIVSKLVAVDGLPIHSISSRGDILRSLLSKQNIFLPKNPSIIAKFIENTYAKCKDTIKSEILKMQSDGQKFSVSVDEYTSSRNHRYLSINLHVKNDYRNLGMVRVFGALHAEKIFNIVQKKLSEFYVDFDSSVVCCVTDGVVCEFSKISPAESLSCYAHALHLAVCDVLYQKQSSIIDEDLMDDTLSDENEDTDDEDFENSSFTITCPPLRKGHIKYSTTELENAIMKVRKICRMFCKSPSYNEKLQGFIFASHNKELQFILDHPTRWNTLLRMLNRFHEVQKCVFKALIDLKIDIVINNSELYTISSVVNALRPIEVALLRLGKRDTNLLSAEGIFKFIISELTQMDTPFATELKCAVQYRLAQTRNKSLVGLLKYLNNPENYVQTSDDFATPDKNSLHTTAAKLLGRLFVAEVTPKPEIVYVLGDGGGTSFSQGSSSLESTLLCDKLNELVEEELREPSYTVGEVNFKNISQELQFYEVTKSRTERLSMLYHALLTIPPTTVETERAFSGVGCFVSKLETQLSDEYINYLSFIRHYFLRRQ